MLIAFCRLPDLPYGLCSAYRRNALRIIENVAWIVFRLHSPQTRIVCPIVYRPGIFEPMIRNVNVGAYDIRLQLLAQSACQSNIFGRIGLFDPGAVPLDLKLRFPPVERRRSRSYANCGSTPIEKEKSCELPLNLLQKLPHGLDRFIRERMPAEAAGELVMRYTVAFSGAEWTLNLYLVYTPKFPPPPPLEAHRRSELRFLLARMTLPFASTISSPIRLSLTRPTVRCKGPIPPPSVIPPIPTVGLSPNGAI